ncbi:hypothetical protein ACTXT7_017639 [Hymenolepis weldensis]
MREEHIITPPLFPQDHRVDADADADADAYVETVQTVIVKPPWMDSVAIGGRDPMPSNKIRLHAIKLSKLRIGWIGENVWGGAVREVVEKEVTKHPHDTESSSLMEAIALARGMEDINKDHLI